MKTIKLLLAALLAGGMSHAARSQVFTSDDITAQLQPGGAHDSTQCMTFGSLSYHVMIENSYLNDTCSLVDPSLGTLMYQVVNTSGQNPWILNVPVFSNVVMDQYLTGNFAQFIWGETKLATPHDTLYHIVNLFQIPVPDPCAYGDLTGRVFIDIDNDCVFNGADLSLSGIPVQVSTTVSNPNTSVMQFAAYTNTGSYNAVIQESWMDSYTVSLPPALAFIFPPTSCNPGSYTYTSLPQTGADFALQCSGNLDVETGIGSSGAVRPNVPFMLHPYVGNTGCDEAFGVLKLVLDPEVTYNASLSSNPAPTVSGDTLSWLYSGLSNLDVNGYWNNFFAGVHLTPTLAVNIGDTLCFKVITGVPAGDVDPSNNVSELCLPVVNSYDPNIKEVLPKGQGPLGYISPQTGRLRYTIHFQNTGNAVAYNINVVDTLSSNLVPSSIKILGASHPMAPQWLSSSVLKFAFNNIMLPDSNANEPGSHGFVTFEVDIAPGIQLGETIENTAHIYFDFNPAIVTNTTLNTIHNVASVTEQNQPEIGIQPNPAASKVRIVAEGFRSVQVIDFSGKTVLESVSLQDGQLDVSALKDGMYIVKVRTEQGTASRKLAIVK